MTKSLEKSLRLEIIHGHKATQKMSLLVLQNPKGSNVTTGREQAGRVAAHRGFQCKAPLGFRCQVLSGLKPSPGALYDLHVFKLLSRSQTGRVFLLKQQLFSVSGSPLKQKTGLFIDPPS